MENPKIGVFYNMRHWSKDKHWNTKQVFLLLEWKRIVSPTKHKFQYKAKFGYAKRTTNYICDSVEVFNKDWTPVTDNKFSKNK